MDSAKDINENIRFLEFGTNFYEKNIVGYIAEGSKVKDQLGKIAVIFNGNKHDVQINLYHDNFIVILDDNEINDNGIYNINSSIINVKPISALIIKYV